MGISPPVSDSMEYFEASYYITLYNKETEARAQSAGNNVDLSGFFS
tara:strand:- start:212 stop:349 length:138 start_codon:yes stop_codon:yes gene_type:complete